MDLRVVSPKTTLHLKDKVCLGVEAGVVGRETVSVGIRSACGTAVEHRTSPALALLPPWQMLSCELEISGPQSFRTS